VSEPAESTVFVHPQALCESRDVGPGTRVWAFAHVMPGARVGADCNICGHAFVESGAWVGDRVTVKNGVLVWEGVTIEDDVFLGPAVVFTNDLRPRAHVKRSGADLLPTLVRRGATLGANATVVCGVTIGSHAFVAAGAVVTRDVPDFAFVAGNPAIQRGWVCWCGERLGEDSTCPAGHDPAVRAAHPGAEQTATGSPATPG
jgi:UDP-2-acetamido-3-amino-2,3-dideoxy-glucuronate N-acetyltransferase